MAARRAGPPETPGRPRSGSPTGVRRQWSRSAAPPARPAPLPRRPARWPTPSGSPRSPHNARSAHRAAAPRSGTAPGAAWSPPPRRRRRSRRSCPDPECPAPPRPPSAAGGDQGGGDSRRADRPQQLQRARTHGQARCGTAPGSGRRSTSRSPPDPVRGWPRSSCRMRIDSAMAVPRSTGGRPRRGSRRTPWPVPAGRRPTASRCRQRAVHVEEHGGGVMAAQRILQGGSEIGAICPGPARPRRPDGADVTGRPPSGRARHFWSARVAGGISPGRRPPGRARSRGRT